MDLLTKTTFGKQNQKAAKIINLVKAKVDGTKLGTVQTNKLKKDAIAAKKAYYERCVKQAKLIHGNGAMNPARPANRLAAHADEQILPVEGQGFKSILA